MNQLTPTVRGALWMLGAVFSFALMAIAVRELQRHMGSFEIVFLRSLGMLAITLAMLPRAGVATIRTTRFQLHLWRNLIHFLRAGAVGVLDRRAGAGDGVRDRVHHAGVDRDPGRALPRRAADAAAAGAARPRPGRRADHPAARRGQLPPRGARHDPRLAVLRVLVHFHQAPDLDRQRACRALLDVGGADADLAGRRACRTG